MADRQSEQAQQAGKPRSQAVRIERCEGLSLRRLVSSDPQLLATLVGAVGSDARQASLTHGTG